MATLHITQDDYGFWMLSHEGDDGALTLVAHQFATADKPLEIARELMAEGRFSGQIAMDSPRPERAEGAAGPGAAAESALGEYVTPKPRKAGA